MPLLSRAGITGKHYHAWLKIKQEGHLVVRSELQLCNVLWGLDIYGPGNPGCPTPTPEEWTKGTDAGVLPRERMIY